MWEKVVDMYLCVAATDTIDPPYALDRTHGIKGYVPVDEIGAVLEILPLANAVASYENIYGLFRR